MNYISLFSGIGAFEKAIKNIGIECELIGFSEIDKFAIKSYCAIHDVDESKNFGDITALDTSILPKDIDLLTYGFPCQDISMAGKQIGLFNADGSRTRSGLFFEALRIIEDTQPKVAIAENVKNLTSKKFKEQFEIVLRSLEEAGYNNYWAVLNAKDFGIPQNRERVLIVSIRKDIDNGNFKFPEGFPLELRLKDMLEDEVDEKFYLDGKFETVTKINNQYSMLNGGVIGRMHDVSRRAWNVDNCSPTIHTCGGGNTEPKVIIKETSSAAVLKAEWISEKGVNYICSPKRGMCTDINANIAQPLTATGQSNWTGSFISPDIDSLEKSTTIGSKEPTKIHLKNGETITSSDNLCGLRIRKLTPLECWRLMGFDDEDFYKAEAVNSNTQLYKQAGNSIVVPVLEHLMKQLLECGVIEK